MTASTRAEFSCAPSVKSAPPVVVVPVPEACVSARGLARARCFDQGRATRPTWFAWRVSTLRSSTRRARGPHAALDVGSRCASEEIAEEGDAWAYGHSRSVARAGHRASSSTCGHTMRCKRVTRHCDRHLMQCSNVRNESPRFLAEIGCNQRLGRCSKCRVRHPSRSWQSASRTCQGQ